MILKGQTKLVWEVWLQLMEMSSKVGTYKLWYGRRGNFLRRDLEKLADLYSEDIAKLIDGEERSSWWSFAQLLKEF